MVAAAARRSALSTSGGDLFFFFGALCDDGFFAFFADGGAFGADVVAGRFTPVLLILVVFPNDCFFPVLALVGGAPPYRGICCLCAF